MKIAYLSSQDTLPESSHRRPDAFEHDLMMQELKPAFSQQKFTLEAVDWNAELDWSTYAAALIGTTWDYCDNFPRFLGRLADIEKATPLFNSVDMVRWNGRKTYLQDLAEKGAGVISTLWFEALTTETLEQSFSAFGTDVVCKYQTGAGAHGQHRIRAGDDMPTMSAPIMVQPFLPTILEEGEISFIFVAGTYCHAVRKRPKSGDYRIQSLYGGTEEVFEPTSKDLMAANQILQILPTMPLYARVDMVRDEQGDLLLMELELIEPYLYPRSGCDLGSRLALALCQALDSSPLS